MLIYKKSPSFNIDSILTFYDSPPPLFLRVIYHDLLDLFSKFGSCYDWECKFQPIEEGESESERNQ